MVFSPFPCPDSISETLTLRTGLGIPAKASEKDSDQNQFESHYRRSFELSQQPAPAALGT